MKTLFASPADDGIGWLPIILLAAALLLCGPADGQTTQPTTKPASTTWYVTSHPGDFATGGPGAPFGVAQLWRNWKPGDTICLKGGDTFGAFVFPKAAGGGAITSWNGRATIDANTGVIMNLCTGSWDIGNVNIVDSPRNPAANGFAPHNGGYGILMLNGNAATLHIHDCSFQWQAIAISVQTATNQHGTVIERCDIGPTYGFNQRAQGIYEEGQYDDVIQDCRFDTCGWYPGVADPINQNHGLYRHGGDAQSCGPGIVRRCTFINCAASGPTSNCGGIFDSNKIIDCAQDGGGIAAWISSDSGTFTNNIVVGGFYNAISRNAVVTGNVFINPSTFAVNVGVPAQSKNWRSATNLVQSGGNVCFGGGPQVTRIDDLGGGVFRAAGPDTALPPSPQLEAAVRQAAKARAGQ